MKDFLSNPSELLLIKYTDGYCIRGPVDCTVLGYSRDWRECDALCLERLLRNSRCAGCTLSMPDGMVRAIEMAFDQALRDLRNGKVKSCRY